jgi:hypothetical protein
VFKQQHLRNPITASILFLLSTTTSAASQDKQPTLPVAPPPLSTAIVPADENAVNTIQTYPTCGSNAQAGYHHGKCKLQVWRTVPISPQTVIVPAGTEVYVELFEARQNETVAFTLTANVSTPHQVGPTLLQNIIPGLNTITETVTIPPATTQEQFEAATPIAYPAQSLAKSIKERQNELVDATNTVLTAVQNAAQAMTCLSNYQTLVPAGNRFTCSQSSMMAYLEFPAAKQKAIDMVNSSTALPLRLNDVADLDAVVKGFYLTCLSYYPHMGRQNPDVADSFCRGDAEALSTREALLDTAISDIQKAQDTLIQTVQTLNSWTIPPKVVIYRYTAQRLTNMSVAITGTEIVSKTASQIATVTINVQAIPVVVSTGIGFSNLKFATYSSSPVIVNGQPVLNPSGSPETVISGSASAFSVMAPTVLVSYRLKRLSDANWENRCPDGCAFLLGGGVGANLTSKEADFDLGPSFEIGGVLFTPALHIGRDTRLSNGLFVGQMLGTNPPSPLPTHTKTVFKGAFVITYSIPLPNF